MTEAIINFKTGKEQLKAIGRQKRIVNVSIDMWGSADANVVDLNLRACVGILAYVLGHPLALLSLSENVITQIGVVSKYENVI